MDREKDLASAVACRCEAISEAVGLRRSTGIDFVRNVIDAFPAERSGPAADRAWRTRAYLLSQAFHCRVPTAAVKPMLRAAWNRGSVAAMHEALLSCPEFHTSRQATAGLVMIPDAHPVMDVSYTTQLGFTSGIQRVVRSLAHHLSDVAPGGTLVRWDDHTSGFVPLAATEAEALARPTARGPGEAGPKPTANRLVRALGRIASWPRRRIERTLRRRRERSIIRQLRQPAVFLWDHALLLPELIGGEAHLAALRLLDDATPVRSTLVFYDAIPIRRPELFSALAHSMYLRSLSLIRHVDAISCISETVRDDLERLLAVMPRRGPLPAVGVHYLGADFPIRAAQPAPAFDRPVVLCVGTIEPRKNQARILRAMIEAQAAGARFTGVFAGNAGWLNGAFRGEFAAAVAAGHSLALHEQLDDGALHELYERAAFTVYCSIDEGFGLPIIESLRRGRPCITSDRGSMREIAVRTGGCVLVDPEDTAAIGAAIHELVADAETRSRLTREAAAATWPSWRDYTETLVGFARTAPAASCRAA
jgi:glycosyltransferase involved in cell wall biosynthesis